MIKVLLKRDYIQISGHAKFDDYGKDVVCASVSSIVYTTINAILNLNKQAIEIVDEGNLTIKINCKDDITNSLINNMIELLTELERQYPKNIKIQ